MSSPTLDIETLPATIDSVEALEDLLALPTPQLVRDLGALEGDIMVLGCGGKVGPTLCRMAKRAAPGKRVIGVARFTDAEVRRRLESWGVQTLACDLLDPSAVARLPRVPHIIYMAGRKFGTGEDPPFTWAMNAAVPATVAQTFTTSRIVAFSTLCVYPFAPAPGRGCDEASPLAPPGEYANSCVARERIFQYYSRRHGNPGRLARLNYAIDLRYGVLLEIAMQVDQGHPIDLSMGYVNVVWQGDASAHILGLLARCTTPASPVNIGALRNESVRAMALEFGRRLGRQPVLAGREADTALITDCAEAARLMGQPIVPLDRMIDWTVHWVRRGLPIHHKPTRYERRDGAF